MSQMMGRTAVAIVLILFASVGTFAIAKSVLEVPEKSFTSLDWCRTMLTAERGVDFIDESANVFQQRCYTYYQTFPKNTVVDVSETKYYFAEAARYVWQSVGEGRVEQLWDPDRLGFWDFSADNHCATLMVIHYDADVSQRYRFTGADFRLYLFEESFRKDGFSFTYMDYINGAYSNKPGGIIIRDDLVIEPGVSYGFAVTSRDPGVFENLREGQSFEEATTGVEASKIPNLIIFDREDVLINTYYCLDRPPGDSS